MTSFICSIFGFDIFVSRQFLKGILAIEISKNGWTCPYYYSDFEIYNLKSPLEPLGHSRAS